MSGPGYPAYPNQQGLVQNAQVYNSAVNGTWSTGLCSWCAPPGGCGLCCMAAFCPCCQYGYNVEKLGPQATCGGSCCGGCCFFCLLSSIGVPCIPQFISRGEIRRMHGMQPGTGADFLTALCCGPCGLCQESREITIRGGAGVNHKGAVQTNAPQAQTMTAQTI